MKLGLCSLFYLSNQIYGVYFLFAFLLFHTQYLCVQYSLSFSSKMKNTESDSGLKLRSYQTARLCERKFGSTISKIVPVKTVSVLILNVHLIWCLINLSL